MSIYEVLSEVIEVIHFFVPLYVVSFMFIPKGRFPIYRQINATFNVTVLILQIICSFRCPLTLLQKYLLEMAHPGTIEGSYAKPFIVCLLKNVFGLQVPGILITITTLIIGGLSIMTLISIGKIKTKQQHGLSHS